MSTICVSQQIPKRIESWTNLDTLSFRTPCSCCWISERILDNKRFLIRYKFGHLFLKIDCFFQFNNLTLLQVSFECLITINSMSISFCIRANILNFMIKFDRSSAIFGFLLSLHFLHTHTQAHRQILIDCISLNMYCWFMYMGAWSCRKQTLIDHCSWLLYSLIINISALFCHYYSSFLFPEQPLNLISSPFSMLYLPSIDNVSNMQSFSYFFNAFID